MSPYSEIWGSLRAILEDHDLSPQESLSSLYHYSQPYLLKLHRFFEDVLDHLSIDVQIEMGRHARQSLSWIIDHPARTHANYDVSFVALDLGHKIRSFSSLYLCNGFEPYLMQEVVVEEVLKSPSFVPILNEVMTCLKLRHQESGDLFMNMVMKGLKLKLELLVSEDISYSWACRISEGVESVEAVMPMSVQDYEAFLDAVSFFNPKGLLLNELSVYGYELPTENHLPYWMQCEFGSTVYSYSPGPGGYCSIERDRFAR